jgi:hypothetical protein
VAWAVALAELAGDPAVAAPAAAEQLVSLLEDADGPAAPTVRAVATGLSRAGLAADGDNARADAFTVLMGRTARLVPDPETKRLHEAALAATARRTGAASSSKATPMLLVGAERALARGDTADASRMLRLVTAEHQPAHRIALLVADVLDGHSPTRDASDAFAETPEPTPRVALALLAAQAAAQAEQDSARSVATLAPVLRDRDLARVVDVRKSLPLLCAEAGNRRNVPEWLTEMVRAAAQSDGHGLDQLALARCAAVTGDEKLASALWRRLFDGEHTSDTGDQGILDEYRQLLTRQAGRAIRAGAGLDAARNLRLAAMVADGRPPGSTIVDEAELEELHRLFLRAVESMSGGSPDEVKTRWHAVMRVLNEALRASDETKVLVFRAQLDDLLATAGRRTS